MADEGGTRRSLFSPVAPVDGLIGKVVKDRYRIVERIGVGNSGVVYRAESLKVNRQVALKVYLRDFIATPPLRRRFERVARSLTMLAHLNVAVVKDWGINDELPYLVVELLRGESLQQSIAAGPLPPKTVYTISEHILRALVFAHGQSCFHDDLTPAKVSVEAQAASVLARVRDLGVARFIVADELDTPAAGPPVTVTGKPFGSPAYMAPERAAGAAPGPQADLYAAGALCFEMITGRPAFRGSSDETGDAVPKLRDRRPGLSPAPELDEFIQRALAPRPADRFADALEMLKALEPLREPLERAMFQPTRASAPPAARPSTPGPEATQDPFVAPPAPVTPPPAPLTPVPAPVPRTPLPAPAAATPLPDFDLIEPGAARAEVPTRRAERRRGGLTLPVVTALVICAIVAFTGAILVTAARDGRRGSPHRTEPVADPEQTDIVPPSTPDEPSVAIAPGPARAAPTEPAPVPVAATVVGGDAWAGEEVPVIGEAVSQLDAVGTLTDDMQSKLRERIREHEGDHRPWLVLGRHRMKLGHMTDALDCYETAHKVNAVARHDPAMIGDLLRAARSPVLGDRAARLIKRVYGREAIGFVREAMGREAAESGEAKRLSRLLGHLEALPPGAPDQSE